MKKLPFFFALALCCIIITACNSDEPGMVHPIIIKNLEYSEPYEYVEASINYSPGSSQENRLVLCKVVFSDSMTIILPQKMGKDGFTTVENFFNISADFSNKKAKVTPSYVEFRAYRNNEFDNISAHKGSNYIATGGAVGYNVNFLYSDSKCKINGKDYKRTYDVNLKAGWNVINYFSNTIDNFYSMDTKDFSSEVFWIIEER